MKLSFTTLGCPGWDLDTVIRRAKEYGYDGIDLRGYLDEMYIPRITAFSTQAEETRKRLVGEGLEISAVSSSARFTLEKQEDLEASMNEARDYMRCASALGCPIVRVFGGAIPAGRTRRA